MSNSKVLHIVLHHILHQPWGADLKVLLFVLIGLILIPAVYNYVIYEVAKVLHMQMGRTFGNDSKVVIGSIGNILHEIEMVVVARLGGHSMQNVHMETFRDIRHFRSTVALNHNWVSSDLYQSIFDFFLGTVPAYLTALLLWGIQLLLGGSTFHLHALSSRMSPLQLLGALRSVFFKNLLTAFSASGFFGHIIYFVLVILIASTAYNLSINEVKNIMSSAIPWMITIAVIWAGFVIAMQIRILSNVAVVVMNFSAFALAHALIYLIVILAIVSILRGIDMISGYGRK